MSLNAPSDVEANIPRSLSICFMAAGLNIYLIAWSCKIINVFFSISKARNKRVAGLFLNTKLASALNPFYVIYWLYD